MTTLRVWAPAATSVAVDLGGDDCRDMKAATGGWWELAVPDAGHGTDYAFRLDGGGPLPDPRSRWQPAGVHGPSRLLDDEEFTWTDGAWRGVPLAGAVVYEMHVGTFTPEGTLDAAIGKLPHLCELGVDLVELMPCAAFPGRHGWGYDGVGLFAVHEPYGGPQGLKRFVDAAHAHGLGVIMDVVYNHLGPDGNYLDRFGPYFTDTHTTPWGPAVNLDAAGSDEVRAFVLDNVLMWLRDYRCDGLRLDAVHALADTRARHLLEEMSAAVERLTADQRRELVLVAESDRNDPRLVSSRQAGGYALDGQWCDDVHHAIWASLSGERQGYYLDFGPLPVLAKALSRAFVHDGGYSTFRGRAHGRPVPDTVPAYRFVVCTQNHDQVGNRATGDRSSASLSDGLLRVAAALLLTSPFTPMLFMGEEWAAATPWRYFTDHHGELGEAVRRGRRREFAAHGWPESAVPDPQDPATVAASTLDWDEPAREPHAGMLDWYRRLIVLRRRLPELANPAWTSVRSTYDEDARWFVVHRGERGGRVAVVCNLAPHRQAVPVDGAPWDVPLASVAGFTYMRGRVELDGESVAIARLL